MNHGTRYTKTQIVAAYDQSSSLGEFAQRLNVTRITARRYCKLHNLPTRIQRDLAPRKSIDMYRRFTGTQTLRDYAAFHGVTLNALCYHLKKAQDWLWSPRAQPPDKPPKELVFPPPGYALIKVANAIWNDPAMIDYPKRLEQETNLSRDQILAYVNQCLEAITPGSPTPTEQPPSPESPPPQPPDSSLPPEDMLPVDGVPIELAPHVTQAMIDEYVAKGFSEAEVRTVLAAVPPPPPPMKYIDPKSPEGKREIRRLQKQQRKDVYNHASLAQKAVMDAEDEARRVKREARKDFRRG